MDSKKKKKKCKHCKTISSLMLFDCKCKNKYCLSCLLPETHNCSFDYVNENKDKLKNSLEKVENLKIIKL